MIMADTTPGIGHNAPPAPLDPIADLHKTLTTGNADLTARRDELSLAYDRLPVKIDNDDEAGRVGDFVRSLDTLIKNAEAARVSAKAPFLALARACDGFFAKITDPAEKLKKKLAPRQSLYLEVKAARERQAREEEAARMREEAARKQREAEEAEKAAREAQEERDRIRREEEAAYARAMEEQRRADEAKRAEAEAKKKADDEAAAKARKEREDADAAAAAALAAARKKSEEEAAASVVAEKAEDRAEKTEKELDRAAAIERQAGKIERTVSEKPAALARTRGDYGSVSTLQTRWVGELTSRADLDLNAIRAFIPEDALVSAINAFVRAGGRSLKGARIFEDTNVQVR
jgi:DNA repair exonuclease SbcCD ATPase subunit